MKNSHYKTEFVRNAPEKLDEATLYMMPHYRVAIHKCMCGCGEQVVTQLWDHGWSWQYDGNNVTLSPSVGNSQYKCRSHYFLRNGIVEWCGS